MSLLGLTYDFGTQQVMPMLQESRETLFRLQRMAGFESQNFDPQVPCHCTASSCMWSHSLDPCHVTMYTHKALSTATQPASGPLLCVFICHACIKL